MSVEYLAHTADVRMRVQGKTLEGLFRDALKGMGNILKDDFCKQTHQVNRKVMVEIKASDNTNLLIDFLSQVLTQSHIENTVFWDVEIIELSEFKIRAKLSGTQVDRYDEDIKAVTYHEANVKQNKKGFWETCIIFDI